MIPRTTRSLIILMGATTALLMSLLGAATFHFADEAMVGQLDARLSLETHALIAAGGRAGVAGVVRDRERQPPAGGPGYLVLDAQGRRVAGSLRAAAPPDGYSDSIGRVRWQIGEARARMFRTPLPGGGHLIVATDRSIVHDADATVVVLFGGAFLLALIFGGGSALAVCRITRGRLAGIAVAAEAIMAGDLGQRMPVGPHDGEFDQMSALINRMLDRIEILLENLRRMSSGVAHDIRSPLTRARSGLEAAERALAGLPEQKWLVASIDAVDEVLDLLQALLGISEIEGFTVRKRFCQLDLGALAEDVVDGYRSVVESSGRLISADTVPANIAGDAPLLRRALANLIDNALLHTPSGTAIRICVSRDRDLAALSVADDGPGVPSQERNNIFDRFVRLDGSRSTPGHGLGLNMVSAIASAHRGLAKVRPNPKGLTIEIRIPLSPSTGGPSRQSSHSVDPARL